jgi:lipopolysaccharide transport system ATP-binding protein
MSEIAVSVENLGKRYTIGHQTERGQYVSLRDVLVQRTKAAWHRTAELFRGKPVRLGDTQEDIWALKDVSFDIARGEVAGIIGHNGAGKSTLLKVLSRITEPSTGRVTITGRVASLLEVGTGFHPELTGRENIFLNGAILGMPRQEIRRKFDEIVAFAEVEKFLDTPVKRYSSGMYVRLAFAVAAHLEPEILIIDEVLAVGDMAFQEKCLGKMNSVASGGRTVLIVSHNIGVIKRLCKTCLYLRSGRLVANGPAGEVADTYLATLSGSKGTVGVWEAESRGPSAAFQFITVRTTDENGEPKDTFARHEPIRITISYTVAQAVSKLRLCIQFMTVNGSVAFSSYEDSSVRTGRPRQPGTYEAVCDIPADLLNSQVYDVLVAADMPRIVELVPLMLVLRLRIVDTSDRYIYYAQSPEGVVCPELKWITEQSGESSDAA